MVKRGLILGGVLAIISLASFSYVYADTTGSTKFSVDVENTVLELTIPATPAVIDLNPTMTGASFGSTNVTVKVATNNITGYQLTMTPTNSQTNTSLIRTELVGSESTYREIETLEQTDPVSTGYPEADFTANRWGYKIVGNNYYGIDPVNTTVSHPSWTTSEPTNGTNHNLTLAAKVDASTVSGSYETTLNFRAVTNATIAKDTISFNANGGTGTMDDIIVIAGESGTLPANTFTPPSGMKFVGWSSTQAGTGEGVVYFSDESTYTATDTGANKNVTLYAQWTLASTPTPSGSGSGSSSGTTFARAYEIAYTAMHKGMYEKDESVGGDNKYHLINSWPPDDEQYHGYDVRFAMQDMTPEICASVTAVFDDYEAVDLRDDKLYHITKLKDGQCWMTQNLDLNLSSELSSDTTDLTQFGTDGYTTTYGYRKVGDTIYWTPARATIVAANNTFVGWSTSATTPDSLDPGNWYASISYSTDNVRCDFITTACSESYIKSTPFDENGTHGHVGNYYNWTAAVASNDTSSFTTNNYSDTSANPHNSVCPKGWRLPLYAGADTYASDFYEIRKRAGFTTRNESVASVPLYFINTGRIYSDGSISTLNYAYFWTNTPDNSNNAWNYRSYDNGQNYGNTQYRLYGFPVRCIAR